MITQPPNPERLRLWKAQVRKVRVCIERQVESLYKVRPISTLSFTECQQAVPPLSGEKKKVWVINTSRSKENTKDMKSNIWLRVVLGKKWENGGDKISNNGKQKQTNKKSQNWKTFSKGPHHGNLMTSSAPEVKKRLQKLPRGRKISHWTEKIRMA